MFIQVEISTHCNFTCFYCAGRDMEQAYMPMAKFEQILGQIPAGRHTVCLQGEGEPTLHPGFWEMAKHIRQIGHVPYTVTNGSRIDAERLAEHFPQLAISIDTLDAVEATRIGRKNLPKVLRNFEKLLTHMGPNRLIVATVDYGQPLGDLIAFVKEKRVAQHMIQPLQVKSDYRQRTDRLQKKTTPTVASFWNKTCTEPTTRRVTFFHAATSRIPLASSQLTS
jgi:MoaA/NifB/PqqE/SkfB family radical SAM enzyme